MDALLSYPNPISLSLPDGSEKDSQYFIRLSCVFVTFDELVLKKVDSVNDSLANTRCALLKTKFPPFSIFTKKP